MEKRMEQVKGKNEDRKGRKPKRETKQFFRFCSTLGKSEQFVGYDRGETLDSGNIWKRRAPTLDDQDRGWNRKNVRLTLPLAEPQHY